MNNYETIFLIKDDITEEQRNAVVDKVKDYLIKNGKVSKEEDLGKKKLAYTVREYQYAYYYIIQFAGEVSTVYDLEKIYRIDENILKFITVKMDI